MTDISHSPQTELTHYDLIVIGSGPAGQRAAIQAAKLGKSVGIIERKPKLGGAGLQTGTIPSKALREVAYAVSVMGSRGMRAAIAKVELPHHFLSEAVTRKNTIIANQESVILNQMLRNGVTLIPGQARFEDPFTLSITTTDDRVKRIRADAIILATGARPRRPESIAFDKTHILDSTSIMNIKTLPKTLTVMGGGVISCEFATIFASLGVDVTIIDSHAEILSFLDSDISGALHTSMETMGIQFHMNAKFESIVRQGESVCTTLENGMLIHSERLLFALGRIPNINDLAIERAGLVLDDRGWLQANDYFQTNVPHIYAIGDLIARPALAAVAMEQGRIAALHAVDATSTQTAALLPVGVYTIPELSSVGKNEHELQTENIDYVAGIGRFAESARGQIVGDDSGLLKLLVCRQSRQILGVHIVGESAAELVHIGQLAMALGGTVDDLVAQVFNYPTLAECYKIAALDCCNQLTRT